MTASLSFENQDFVKIGIYISNLIGKYYFEFIELQNGLYYREGLFRTLDCYETL